MVVTTPLVVALGIGTWHVDRLASESQAEVYRAVAATETLADLARTSARLERLARQYILFRHEEFLQHYRQERARFQTELRRFDDTQVASESPPRDVLSPEPLALAIAETTLFVTAQVEDGPREAITPLFQRVYANLERLSRRNYELIHDGVERSEERSERAQQVMFLNVAAAVPLTLAFTWFFARQIHRPIRAMGQAIRQLGGGRFAEALPAEGRPAGPRDLEALHEELEWLRRRLEALEGEREQFIRHVSHELKTPLASVLEATDLLDSQTVGGLSARQREVTRILRDNTETLRGMIERMLEQARTRNFGVEEEDTPLRLDELVRTALEAHRLAMERRDLRGDARLEELQLTGRRGQLLSVADNLLSNAVKHSPESGTVRVRLRRDGDEAVLRVEDEGEGFGTRERETIFEPFARSGTSGGGKLSDSGIGLALTRDYVHRHGGRIHADNAPRGGAVIEVRLPLTHADAGAGHA